MQQLENDFSAIDKALTSMISPERPQERQACGKK